MTSGLGAVIKRSKKMKAEIILPESFVISAAIKDIPAYLDTDEKVKKELNICLAKSFIKECVDKNLIKYSNNI